MICCKITATPQVGVGTNHPNVIIFVPNTRQRYQDHPWAYVIGFHAFSEGTQNLTIPVIIIVWRSNGILGDLWSLQSQGKSSISVPTMVTCLVTVKICVSHCVGRFVSSCAGAGSSPLETFETMKLAGDLPPARGFRRCNLRKCQAVDLGMDRLDLISSISPQVLRQITAERATTEHEPYSLTMRVRTGNSTPQMTSTVRITLLLAGVSKAPNEETE
ncbi:hypothetical protein BU15DRAFT_66281 [Melanogaster broomeanus]|nr:hypothetical protein BU15DRAFT_66281 [Melanogaster broomeanus]